MYNKRAWANTLNIIFILVSNVILIRNLYQYYIADMAIPASMWVISAMALITADAIAVYVAVKINKINLNNLLLLLCIEVLMVIFLFVYQMRPIDTVITNMG